MKAVRRRTPDIRVAHLIALVLFVGFVAAAGLPPGVFGQAPQVQVTELQCSRDPEVVALTNQGSSAQDLTGWSLKSDPVSSESFDLTPIGTLSPGVTVFIQSGPSANGTFVWSQNFVFRDGDPSDFVRVVDPNRTVIHEATCQGTSASAGATPTAAPTSTSTAAPTRAPTGTAVPAGADVIPVGGGPPGSADNPVAILVLAAGLLTIGVGATGLFMQMRPSRSAVTATDRRSEFAVSTIREGQARWLYLLILAGLLALAARMPGPDRDIRPRS